MTGDRGPGEEFPQDLSTIFSSYLPPAAGLASQRGQDDLAALLSGGSDLEASFAPYPVTSDDGRSFASVDIVLRVPPDGPEVGKQQRRMLTDILDEVIEGDGYRVRELRVEPSDEGA